MNKAVNPGANNRPGQGSPLQEPSETFSLKPGVQRRYHPAHHDVLPLSQQRAHDHSWTLREGRDRLVRVAAIDCGLPVEDVYPKPVRGES